MRATVVLLNGVGSSGKSSIARALQELTDKVFLRVEMDAFLEMLPPSMLEDPRGFVFEVLQGAEGPEVQISSGPVGARLMRGMRRSVAALADAGNDLIVDDVTGAAEVADYRDLLADHDLVLVGVMASLDVLERRERDRGDRMIGLARWQYDRVHRGIDYDFTVDTSAVTARQCAEAIAAHLKAGAP